MSIPTPLYDADGIRLFHGDCRDILPLLGLRADLVLTDPPYSEQTHKGARTGDAKNADVLVDFPALLPLQMAGAFAAISGAASRWVVATVDWKHAALLEKDPPPGLRFVRLGVWVKEGGMPQMSGDRPAQGWEAVAILHRDGGRMHWQGGGRPAVWSFSPARDAEYPTQKPLTLIRRLILLFSDPGGLIIDPFCGSGTTLVAAREQGLPAVGIDVSKRALETAVRRLRQREMFGPPEAA